MSRKGLLEALLGVAYEDDQVETQPAVSIATRPTRPVGSTSTATPQPTTPTQPVTAARETVTSVTSPDDNAPTPHDAADTQVQGSYTRVGMLGGMLGMLEHDDLPPAATPAKRAHKGRQPSTKGQDGKRTTGPVPAPALSDDTDAVAADVVADTGERLPHTADSGVRDDQRDDAGGMPEAVVEDVPHVTGHSQNAAPLLPPPGAPTGLAAPVIPAAPYQPPVVAAPTLPPPPATLPAPPQVNSPTPPPAPLSNTTAALHVELGSFDVHRRRRALLGLLTTPITPEIVAVVADSLTDPEADLRHLALQVLERIPEAITPAMLAPVTGDTDTTVRSRALTLAGRSTTADMVDAVITAIIDEYDTDVIADGLNALTALARAVILGDTQYDMICRGVGAITRHGHDGMGRHIHLLATTVSTGDILHRLNHTDPDVRVGACVLASETNDDDAKRAIARLVADSDPIVRQFASASVAARHTPTATDRAKDPGETSPDETDTTVTLVRGLLDATHDQDVTIRTNAANALAHMDPTTVVAAIDTLSRTASDTELARLITAVTQLEFDACAEPIAHALIAGANGPLTTRLHAAARTFSALTDIAQLWRAGENSARRCDGTHLAALLELPESHALRDAMSDEHTVVRHTAVTLAVRLGLIDAVRDSITLLIGNDPSVDVQLAALAALEVSPPAVRLTAARRGAGSPDTSVRLAALALADTDTDDAVALVTAALNDADATVVGAAATMLSRLRPLEAVATLWGHVVKQTAHRDVLVRALHDLDAHTLRRLAANALTSTNAHERIAGLTALQAFDEPAQPEIVAAMRDVDVTVRCAAIDALAATGGHSLVTHATEAMDDPAPQVRARAAAALITTGDTTAVTRAFGALDDAAPVVRDAVVDAVRASHTPLLIDLLVAELDRPAHRQLAAELLAFRSDASTRVFDLLATVPEDDARRNDLIDALRQAGRVDEVRANLAHHDPAVRGDALRRLQHVAGPNDVPVIAERLDDPDPNVRLAAVGMLKFLGGPVAVEALQRAFATDPNMDVVAAIEDAYRTILTDD